MIKNSKTTNDILGQRKIHRKVHIYFCSNKLQWQCWIPDVCSWTKKEDARNFVRYLNFERYRMGVK